MTALEAMAFGRPLVATDLPPVRELVADTALLVPVDDAGALAEALGRLLDDEAARRALGEAAGARASAYSWERMAEHVVGAYRRALAR
jgi:MMP alpha-(1->4)-mannosyltransferase